MKQLYVVLLTLVLGCVVQDVSSNPSEGEKESLFDVLRLSSDDLMDELLRIHLESWADEIFKRHSDILDVSKALQDYVNNVLMEPTHASTNRYDNYMWYYSPARIEALSNAVIPPIGDVNYRIWLEELKSEARHDLPRIHTPPPLPTFLIRSLWQ